MNWLKKTMAGRYGMDELNWALLVGYMLMIWISNISTFRVFSSLGLVVLFLMYFRVFSKNASKRYQENRMFMRWYTPIKQKTVELYSGVNQRVRYKSFSCTQCKQKLRVPRRKGKITVTCPKCYHKFDGKS